MTKYQPRQRKAIARFYSLTEKARQALATWLAWPEAPEATERLYILTAKGRAAVNAEKAQQISKQQKIYLHWSDGPIPVYTEHRSVMEAEEYARERGLKAYKLLTHQLGDEQPDNARPDNVKPDNVKPDRP